MSSNYVSLGRAAQVYWENGQASLIARRETLDDIVRMECDEAGLIKRVKMTFEGVEAANSVRFQ